MPRFDFKCATCGETFEKTLPYSSAIRSKCLVCGSSDTLRLFTNPPGIVFGTTGFYHIDSGKRFESQLSPKGKQVWEKAKQKAGI